VNSQQEQAPEPGERASGGARRIARAVAEREQGRRRLNATTVTVSAVSVLAVGGVAAILPGAAHATSTSTGKSSSASSGSSTGSSPSGSSGSSTGPGASGSSGSSDDGSGSGTSSSQGSLQAPASAPQAVTGGSGGSTSGGT
jgi:hypothetical protein